MLSAGRGVPSDRVLAAPEDAAGAERGLPEQAHRPLSAVMLSNWLKSGRRATVAGEPRVSEDIPADRARSGQRLTVNSGKSEVRGRIVEKTLFLRYTRYL